MIGELIHGMMNSTPQGMVGVSLIFIYMAWIVCIALLRVREARQEDSH